MLDIFRRHVCLACQTTKKVPSSKVCRRPQKSSHLPAFCRGLYELYLRLLASPIFSLTRSSTTTSARASCSSTARARASTWPGACTRSPASRAPWTCRSRSRGRSTSTRSSRARSSGSAGTSVARRSRLRQPGN
ncbi:hypothetical protein PsYK624_043040 [Phanerochaete sordida]|uniref:Uncharacterized protein n=1 Tax=Phanerochaete sordida TaxID=48140 RepID=A0A9P3G4N7_9APHY|nr:hypothetical protein PsYK624_043040 [Phanerochaete sordida]